MDEKGLIPLPLPPSAPERALRGEVSPALPPPERPLVKRRHPEAVEAGRPHQWNDATPKGQPSWLNADNGRRACKVCGVEEIPPGGFVMADHAGMGQDPVAQQASNGKRMVEMYTYIDAKGNQFTSMTPLGCPTFMLDHKGMTMENRERIRQVDDRVDRTEDRVDDVAALALSHDDRLAQLERENAELRTRVDAAQADIGAVVSWLRDMAALHAAQQREMVMVQVEGRDPVALPPPVADLILDLGSVKQKEPVPVRRRDEIIDAEFVEVEPEGGSDPRR